MTRVEYNDKNNTHEGAGGKHPMTRVSKKKMLVCLLVPNGLFANCWAQVSTQYPKTAKSRKTIFFKIPGSKILNDIEKAPKHRLDLGNIGWTFELMAGRSQYWLGFHNLGRTFEVLVGRSKYWLDVQKFGRTFEILAGHSEK